MTILFFSRLFYPHGGGVETHVREIGKRLVQMGHTVTVVTELPESYNTSYHSSSLGAKLTAEIDGIKIVRFDGGKEGFWKKFRIWLWLFRHKTFIYNADIVHAHDVFFWYLPFRFMFPRKPVYTTFHGYETVFPPRKKAIVWRKISEKLSFGNICVGGFIEKWYGTKADFVIYGGANLPKAQSSKIKDQKNSQKLKILFIGRLEEDIGIGLYLQAIRELKKNRNVEVTFLGEGSYKKEAEEMGTVTTAAYADKKEFDRLLQNADVVFASSYLSMLSAMAAKRSIVSVYTNPLKKDYLEMTPFGKYISIKDSVDGIVEAVYDVQKQKIEKAYEWVKDQTWDRVVEVYLKLWKI